MKYRKLVMSLLLTVPVFASAADAPAKEAICRACHGVNGAKPIMDSYPKLNGQSKGYLISALKAYRAGERKGGLSVVMTGQAGALSDADIESLSAFYASAQ